MVLQQVVADNNKIGIEIDAASSTTQVNGANLTGDRVGAYVRNAANVTLSQLKIQDPSLIGALLDAPGTQILGSSFVGSNLAVELRATAQLVNVSIDTSDRRGIAIYPNQSLTAEHLHVMAKHVGLELGPGATALVRDSTLLAPVPHSGGKVTTVQTKQETLPISWVIIIVGLGLLACAVALEVVRHLRERRVTQCNRDSQGVELMTSNQSKRVWGATSLAAGITLAVMTSATVPYATAAYATSTTDQQTTTTTSTSSSASSTTMPGIAPPPTSIPKSAAASANALAATLIPPPTLPKPCRPVPVHTTRRTSTSPTP